MGRPKALLDFGGRTCLELVLDACREAGLGPPMVVTRTELLERITTIVSGTLATMPATLLENRHPDRGQTSSLRLALDHLPAQAEAFLIFPVDHPLVTGADVACLCEAFAAARPRVAAPSYAGRRGHPVVVDAALAPTFRALPDDGAARTVLSAHAAETAWVVFEDDRILSDMDTPEAYESCRRRLAGGGR